MKKKVIGKPKLKKGWSIYAVSDWLFEHRLARQLAGNRTMSRSHSEVHEGGHL